MVNMRAKELYKEIYEKKLYNFSSFNLNCIFEEILGAKSPFSLCERVLTDEEILKIEDMCKRLSEGEPLQYILGKWEFYGLPFLVGEGVLIPRGDTEAIVEESLNFLDGIKNPKIADLCAGTGAIGIALAAEKPDSNVYSIELYDAAFSYLEKNIALNKLQKRVIPLKKDINYPVSLNDLDLLVSNPPYIRKSEMEGLDIEVKREPVTALMAEENGLHFYYELAKRGMESLKKGGRLIVEIGWTENEEVCEIFKNAGYEDVYAFKDLAGNFRGVSALKNF